MLTSIRLLSLYHTLHASVHAKMTHLKVHHCISRESISLAWITPLFELYCVAGPNANRNALAQSANKIVQWVRREEERVFIIGGAVRFGGCPCWLTLGLLTLFKGLLNRSFAFSLRNENQTDSFQT